MSHDNLIRLLETISELPTLPTVYMRLNQLMQSPEASATEIARIIESDQALSSKVLRLVNSSFFGFSRRVTQISHAVVLLGFNTLRNTVLSISVFESFKSNDNEVFDRREFWRHCIATGLIAQTLARSLKIEQVEEAFSGGVLHDLGKLVLDQFLPEPFAQIIDLAREQRCPILEAERSILGTDHTEIGEYLMERWNLPHVLIEMVALHHTPSVMRSNPTLVSVVHIADILSRRLKIGFGGDPLVPEIDPFALDELDLSPERLDEMLEDIEQQMQQAEDVLALVD